MEGNGQEEFERANPLPDSFTNGSRAMLATFITTGCDTVRCQLAPIVGISYTPMHLLGIAWVLIPDKLAAHCAVFKIAASEGLQETPWYEPHEETE